MKKFLLFLVILAFPITLFAKGAIIPYAAGWISQRPTATELDRMTHLMIFQMFPDANGNLITSGMVPSWIQTATNEAQAKGVKVSIALGGASDNYTPNFVTATNSQNLSRLVNNVRNFVNQYNLDGVDIDWEFPKNDQEWRQCMDLIVALKNAMPNKRISIAIGGDSPVSQFGNHFVKAGAASRDYIKQNIIKADGIHIMTYDMMGVTQPVRWNTHADLEASKRCLDDWAAFIGQEHKEKLFMGVAFYPTQNTNGDNASTAAQKVNYCYDKGYGGVIIWELSQDRGNGSLLTSIYNANQAKGGYVAGGGGGNPSVVNHTITMTHNGYGSVTSGGNPVNSGGNVSVANGQNVGFTFTPQQGYSVTDIKNNNQSQTAANNYTFNNVTSSRTLDVTFSRRYDFPSTFNATGYSKKSAEITANNDNYGRYVGNLANNSSLEYMINITGGAGRYKLSAQTATGDANLRNLTAKIGQTTVGTIAVQGHTGGWFNFVAREIEFDLTLSGNQTLTLQSSGAVNIKDIIVTKMAENKHLITVTHNPYGTVGGGGEVNNGANATLTFTPQSGYQVTDIKVGGSSVATANSYTINNVTSPKTVDVAFSKRFSVPTEFNATEYSKKSSEIKVENADSARAKRSIGYLENNSQFEFMIGVADAGKYVIGVETAIGQSGTRELSLHSGANAIGKISVPGGSDWFAFRSRGVVVELAAGEQTLRFVADGSINVRNITISKENENGGEGGENPKPPIINEDIDLVDGSWDWENIRDDANLGSQVSHELINGGGLKFDITIGEEDAENEIWTWSEITCVPGGNWTGVTGITVNYTSDKPLELTLLDNFKLADAGRGYLVKLPAGTNVTRTIQINEFKHLEDDWETWSDPLTTEQLYAFKGVSVSPGLQDEQTKGTFAALIIHGLFVEPEEENGEGNQTSIQRKAVSKVITAASASVMNGNIKLSLPSGAKNANIVLFDARGRILFERNIAISGNAASVALPKHILHNQVAILRIKTNSGVNLTKRVLIK